jgi:hypothetical protein
MQLELWHLLTLGFTLVGGGWAFIVWVSSRFENLDAKMTKQHEARILTQEQHKNVSDANFARLGQKDAELALSIATLRLEVAKESQNFVTRAELDRRMERLEDIQGVQNNKLDEIIRHVAFKG